MPVVCEGGAGQRVHREVKSICLRRAPLVWIVVALPPGYRLLSTDSATNEATLRLRLSRRNILLHKLAYNLRCGLVYGTARFEESVTERTLDPDAEPCILRYHGSSVTMVAV